MSSSDTVPPSQSGPSPEALAVTSGSTTPPTAPPAANDAASTSPKAEVPSAESTAPVTTTSNPQSAAERAFQHGLNAANLEQEVNQVMGTLNSWWGGVKKQSASALSSIKADIDKTVIQAQADIEHLRTAKIEIVRKEDNADTPTPAADRDVKGKGKAADSDATDASTSSSSTPVASNLFNRLTSSTTQLQQSLQTTFQSTIASAANNPALSNPSQLREQLAKNLQLSSAKENLQLSMKQAEKMAEEYLRKGDQWVKDAEKWMGDAVKVLPPDDPSTRYISTSWDGGEFYAFTTSSNPSPSVSKGNADFEAQSRASRPNSSSSAPLAGSRKEALLRRLREDQELLLVNPEGEAETEERREVFRSWVRDSWEKVKESEKSEELGNVGPIRMALVPEHLTDEQFWQRYLFHKYMIEASEEKRKKLLEETQQVQADDFSWDDEPEDVSTTKQSLQAQQAQSPKKPAAEEAKPVDPTIQKLQAASGGKAETKLSPSTATSPRDSEESYDLVSDQGVKAAKTAPTTSADDDEDSDWE